MEENKQRNTQNVAVNARKHATQTRRGATRWRLHDQGKRAAATHRSQEKAQKCIQQSQEGQEGGGDTKVAGDSRKRCKNRRWADFDAFREELQKVVNTY